MIGPVVCSVEKVHSHQHPQRNRAFDTPLSSFAPSILTTALFFTIYTTDQALSFIRGVIPMVQISMLSCDCCGQPIDPKGDDHCPHCQYPANPVKEESF